MEPAPGGGHRACEMTPGHKGGWQLAWVRGWKLLRGALQPPAHLSEGICIKHRPQKRPSPAATATAAAAAVEPADAAAAVAAAASGACGGGAYAAQADAQRFGAPVRRAGLVLLVVVEVHRWWGIDAVDFTVGHRNVVLLAPTACQSQWLAAKQ